MTLATSKKPQPLANPTITKERAFKLNEDILELGEKMGAHLLEMRDTAGYRHLGYRDFASYCKNEFGHSKSRAYQLLEEAQIEAEIRQESKILESRKIPGSQLRILGKNVAPADRVKVLEYTYRLAEEEQRKPTADDLKAAAIAINGGIPNKQGKWAKPLAKIGYEKGVEVIANSQLPTRVEGVIKKIREDGRADVYISKYNTTLTYSFEDLELAAPRTHKPLKKDECELDQKVLVFSSRMHISGEVGTIVGCLKETAFVKIDARTEELRYDELAAIEEEKGEEKASEAIVDVVSSTVEGDSFEWGKWTQKYLPRLTTWLAKYATDKQRLDIFSALAEQLSPEAKEAAISIFGGTINPPILEKKDEDEDNPCPVCEQEMEEDDRCQNPSCPHFDPSGKDDKQIDPDRIADIIIEIDAVANPKEGDLLGIGKPSIRVERVEGEDAHIRHFGGTESISLSKGLIRDCGYEVYPNPEIDSFESEPIANKSEPIANDSTTFEIGDRIEVVQPEGWCEIAYANPGQTGIIQGKAKGEGNYHVLLSEPPAAGKRQDVALATPRIKLVEQPTATEILGSLNQQIAALENNIIAEKQRLEANLASATKQAERKKIKKNIAHQNERLSHLKIFSSLKIGATVNRYRSTEKGVVKQLDFSVGGMPQVWVEWEQSTFIKPEAVASIELSVDVEDIELDEIEKSILAAISDDECVSKQTLKFRTGLSLIEIEEALTKLEQVGLVEDTDSRNIWRTTTKKKSLTSPLPSDEF